MFVPTASTLEEVQESINDLPSKDKGSVSDGNHSFDELYDFRCAYNAALFSLLAREPRYNVHKSYKHDDGKPCFGKDTLFVVQATLPTGQVSNHYHKDKWELFSCEERETADKWDKHTPEEALERLEAFCKKITTVK